MESRSRGRAALPLIEIIIAITVLAICSIIIIGLFISSHYAGKLSADMNSAFFKAESEAEIIKAEGINENKLNYEIKFDEDWQETQGTAIYILTVELDKIENDYGYLLEGIISVNKKDKYPFLEEERKNLVKLNFKDYIQKGGITQNE